MGKNQSSGAEDIRSFEIHVPQDDIDDLKRRLAATRWPTKETAEGWEQGVPLAKAQELAAYWKDQYDWRRFEERANAFPQFMTEIDGLDIHFIHVRSRHENAIPLLLMHGWPGSIVEFIKLIEPLTDPEAHGGRADDAFHVVVPSLPGWGFTEPPREVGWDMERTARMSATLMQRLGYDRWFAQGGDYGAAVLTVLGQTPPPGLAGLHLNILFAVPSALPEDAPQAEIDAIEAWRWTQVEDGGYSHMQRTRPQTLGYGLVDSPVAQATWIYEKFYRWTDNQGEAEDAISRDEMLDNISLHWFTKSSVLSARAYWEARAFSFDGPAIDVPVAATLFKRDIFKYPRRWAEEKFRNLIFWNEVDRGAHFGTLEQPGDIVQDVREAFRQFR